MSEKIKSDLGRAPTGKRNLATKNNTIVAPKPCKFSYISPGHRRKNPAERVTKPTKAPECDTANALLDEDAVAAEPLGLGEARELEGNEELGVE